MPARLGPRLRERSAKCAVALGPSVTMTDGGPVQAAAAALLQGAWTASARIATARMPSSPSAG